MLYYELPIPVILPRHFEDIEMGFQKYLPYLDGEAMAELMEGYRVINGDGRILRICDLPEIENGAVHVVRGDKESLTDEECLVGAEAIDWLFRQADADPREIYSPVERIEVPATVFYEADLHVWNDICLLFARVEERSKRLKKMYDLACPAVIAINEYRFLMESVAALNQNAKDNEDPDACYPASHRPEGRICRSLADVGYDLEYGWSEEMERHFEKNAECDPLYDILEPYDEDDEEQDEPFEDHEVEDDDEFYESE